MPPKSRSQLLTHYDLPFILSGIRCRFDYKLARKWRPFAECLAPKFAPEKTELRYHSSSQLGQLLREHILSHENELFSDRHMRFGEHAERTERIHAI